MRRGCPTRPPCPSRVADGDRPDPVLPLSSARRPAVRDRVSQRLEPAPGTRVDATARAGRPSGGRRGTPAARAPTAGRGARAVPRRERGRRRDCRGRRPRARGAAAGESAAHRRRAGGLDACSASRWVSPSRRPCSSASPPGAHSPTRSARRLAEAQRTTGGGRGQRLRAGAQSSRKSRSHWCCSSARVCSRAASSKCSRSIRATARPTPSCSTVMWTSRATQAAPATPGRAARAARRGPCAARRRTEGLVNAFPLGGGWFANGRFVEMSRLDEFTSIDDFRKLDTAAKTRTGFAGYRIASEDYFR